MTDISTPDFATWREYGENLGRYASIREKADSPMDRIVIQHRKGVQKLVAGDHSKTLVITVGPTNQPDGKAVVSARMMLSVLKSLKGKGSAELRLTDKGAVMQTSFGSTMEFEVIEGYFKFLTPQPFRLGNGRIVKLPIGFLPAAAKYLAYTGDFAPFNQVLGVAKGGSLYLRSTEDHILAKVGPIDAEGNWTIHFPEGLFPAMKGLEQAGGLYVPEHVGPQVHQAQFFSGPYRVTTVIYPNYGKFPEVAEYEYTASVVGDKKVLIDTFKALAARHQYSYAVMEAEGGKFTVRSGGSGAATPDVQCTGDAKLPVNAMFMNKVLQTVDGKTATIQFSDAPSVVRVTGDKNNWPILVSPMTRSPMG